MRGVGAKNSAIPLPQAGVGRALISGSREILEHLSDHFGRRPLDDHAWGLGRIIVCLRNSGVAFSRFFESE